jgi:hypothetical protein
MIHLLDKSEQLDMTPLRPLFKGDEKMLKRAQAKAITQELVSRQLRYVEELPDTPRRGIWLKRLNVSANCSRVLFDVQDGLKTKFCGARWCLVCNRIRIARYIDAYQSQIEGMRDPYFVTLTQPNVPAQFLPLEIDGILGNRSWLSRGKKLRALAKLEVTYNIQEDTYHPHQHLIVDSMNDSEYIVDQWLSRYPMALPAYQKIQKVEGPGAAKELMKYFTKLVTKMSDGNGAEILQFYPPNALHTMFDAMRSRRVFQPYGLSRVPKVEGEGGIPIIPRPKDWENVWTYDVESFDWSTFDGELFTGYQPSARINKLINERVLA